MINEEAADAFEVLADPTRIAIRLRSSGAPLVPVVCLGGAPVALVAHGTGTTDVLGMVLFAVGTMWLELCWKRPGDRRVE